MSCRKLRRGLETQIMADLPDDRMTPGPDFTSFGIDVFGPWEVSTCRTREGAANSERWGQMFNCLTSRADKSRKGTSSTVPEQILHH